MVNRRVGRSARFKKKKMKFSARLLNGGGVPSAQNEDEGSNAHVTSRRGPQKSSKKSLRVSAKDTRKLSLAKQKSALLKKQAAERMVLKEHVRALKVKRENMRKGDDVKRERRELGKYIRQLEEEQKKKHATELDSLNKDLKSEKRKASIAGSEMVLENESISEQELRDMFAHFGNV